MEQLASPCNLQKKNEEKNVQQLTHVELEMSGILHKSIMKNLKNESLEMHECSRSLCKIAKNLFLSG